jgi:two-component system phosphate regulon response regulator PhoB
MGYRAAVVEDEKDIRETLCYSLEREGYEVNGFGDGATALLAFRDRVPDVVIIDWMLPGMSGIDLCRILRGDQRFNRTGLLMLTARGTEMDVVAGLGSGADDYVIKPFRTRELLARVKAVLRRYTAEPDSSNMRRVGDIWLDTATYRSGSGDTTFDLTPTEFKILELLVRHPGRVYSRGQILNNLWPDDKAVEDRAVDVHIARLRDKMGTESGRVETVRGVGYRLRAE